jgi:hypothetical protein
MGHRQTGYAIVEIAYDMGFTRVFEERGREAVHLPMVHKTEYRRGFDATRLTYYAQCRRNETGDEKLSQWYKEIARLVIEDELAERIRYSNEVSQARTDNWYEMVERGVNTPGSWPPPRVIYDEFDARLVKVKKLDVSPDPPSNTKAEELEWLPSTTQYY